MNKISKASVTTSEVSESEVHEFHMNVQLSIVRGRR